MTRTLGFFLGSAVVFAMLVFVLGQPVSLAPPPDRDPSADLLNPAAPVRIPAPVPQRDTTLSQTARQAVAQPAAPQPLPTPSPETPAQTIAKPEPVPTPEPVTVPAGTEPVDENALTENWLASASRQPTGDEADPEPADTVDQAALVDTANDTVSAVGQMPQMEWFPVWDPFHSELSANAFARRLERVTGLDYRVIKTSATQYRVAMGYSSEKQRLVNVQMIEEATGLTINGGSR